MTETSTSTKDSGPDKLWNSTGIVKAVSCLLNEIIIENKEASKTSKGKF